MADRLRLHHVQVDDWNWYFVNGKLIDEGHAESLDVEVLSKVLDAADIKHDMFHLWLEDMDLAAQASMQVETLEEFVELGLDMDDFE